MSGYCAEGGGEVLDLVIGHLYPEALNLYGDRGNVLVLIRRAARRLITVRVEELRLGDRFPLDRYDLVFIGGGPDLEQSIVSKVLQENGPCLKEAVEAGTSLLAICGGYQLLGNYYRLRNGREVPGVGLFDIFTTAGERRLKGNIAFRLGEELTTDTGRETRSRVVVGFENHSGSTYLGDCQPLGYTIYGCGNNGSDGTEGARYRNAFGSYLHGPLLAKNPLLADELLSRALSRRHGTVRLSPLDDSLEIAAGRAILRRFAPAWRRLFLA